MYQILKSSIKNYKILKKKQKDILGYIEKDFFITIKFVIEVKNESCVIKIKN